MSPCNAMRVLEHDMFPGDDPHGCTVCGTALHAVHRGQPVRSGRSSACDMYPDFCTARAPSERRVSCVDDENR